MTISDDKLVLAIRLIKQGNKQEGAKILANLLTLEPGLELAWLWLADCSESRERKIHCLQMAIKLNPNRAASQKALIDLMCVTRPTRTIISQMPIDTTPKIARQKSTNKKPTIVPNKRLDASSKIVLQQSTDSTPTTATEKPIDTTPTIAFQNPIKSTSISLNVLRSPVSFSTNEPIINKQERDSTSKYHTQLPKPENKFVPPDLANLNIQKIIREKKNRKLSKGDTEIAIKQDTQVKTPEKDNDVNQLEKKGKQKKRKSAKKAKASSESAIPYIAPKRISVKSGENLCADVYWQHHKYPNTDAGMYGNTMFIDNVRINASSMPRCLDIGKILDFASCDLCTFFGPRECIIRNDPELLDDLRIFIVRNRKRTVSHR